MPESKVLFIMADVVSKKKRSKMMAGIQGKNTKPELKVRKALHHLGFRYKLHDKTLPGKPDLVFPKYNAVIFIHGCFWHGHGCHLFKWPSTRTEFWKSKILGNKKRDRANNKKLLNLHWRVLTVWECAMKGKYKLDFESTVISVSKWLKSSDPRAEIAGKK
jgi:DNA mismatch endonuclease (patch repair protein)